jgi:uncharacterized protein (TIGR02284 family)
MTLHTNALWKTFTLVVRYPTNRKTAMESNREIINDLKDLLSIVNDGKEGYETASEATDKIELQGIFLRYSAQRALYASELKDHIATHGGKADNDNGGVLGALHRTWIDIKQTLSGNNDKAILNAVVSGEAKALQKYNGYIADYQDHADHIELLRRQRDGIEEAAHEMQSLMSARNQ